MQEYILFETPSLLSKSCFTPNSSGMSSLHANRLESFIIELDSAEDADPDLLDPQDFGFLDPDS